MQDFFAFFFEFFGTATCAASDDLYDLVYIPGGFLWIAATALWVTLFYLGFWVYRNKARWDTRGTWLLWMLISSVLTTSAIWMLSISQFKSNDLIYEFPDYATFLCMVFLWSAIAYFLFSIPAKYMSPARRKIPF